MNIDNKSIQKHLLCMVKKLHKFCIEHNITYYIIEGTCLGACRHSGFIPWDDDIDIGMPREDYERFCMIANKELPEDLELLYYKNNAQSPFHFAKLINNQTTLIEKKYKNYIEGLYIDIFPLDYVGRLNANTRARCKLIWRFHSMIINHCSTDPMDNLSIIRKIDKKLSKKLSLSWLHTKLDKIMNTVLNGEPIYMSNFLGAYNWVDIIPLEYYGKPLLYDFEDTQLFGPEKIDEYLAKLYGDYMVMPPEEKRIAKHDYFYLDLTKPYKIYKGGNNRQ